MKKLGYDVCGISTYIDEDLQEQHIRNINTKDRIANIPASLIQWYGMAYLCEKKDPCVLLLHNIVETHMPCYYCGMKNTWFEQKKGHYSDSDQYAMKMSFQYQEQLVSNFIDMLNVDKATVIIMSDHGRPSPMLHRWDDVHSHSFFLLYGNKISANKVVDGFFQYNQLGMLIEQIVDDVFCPEELVTEYASIQNEDYYSSGFCDEVLSIYKAKQNTKNTWMEFVQYLGVVTKEEKYIKFPIGELYYDKYGQQLDITDVAPEKIKKLRDCIMADFIDLSENERYKNTLDLYKAIGLVDQCGNWIQQM